MRLSALYYSYHSTCSSRYAAPRTIRLCHASSRFSLQILTHVDPMSLRHVSRTSQALRDTLTGSRSNRIWRASYANTDHGLPSVPNDMTVPQFLSFLVDRVCDVRHFTMAR